MGKKDDDSKKHGADFPDIKKIEKDIHTGNENKVTEIPDAIPDDKPENPLPLEMPERKEEDELEDPD